MDSPSITLMDILTKGASSPTSPLNNASFAHLNNVTRVIGDDLTSFYNQLSEQESTYFFAQAICCSILCSFGAIKYITLDPLRASEQQHLRDTFWDYVVHKVIFIIFVLDVETPTERSLWFIWFTTLGSILLLAKLCKDRFEYLSSSPATKTWPLIKISILMTLLLTISILSIVIIPITDLTTHSLFQLADASYVLTFVVSVITRFFVLTSDLRPNSVSENNASLSYFTDLIFSVAMLIIELLQHFHQLLVSHTHLIIRGLCLMKIHTLLTELRRRYKRHKHYLLVVQLMETNFEVATKEEIDNFRDECAICWDGMETARKLPCGHLFHNACLRSWLEQDTSCPTCRTSFKGQHQQHRDDLTNMSLEDHSESDDDFIEAARSHQRNHLFHFDSSRYTNNPFLNWLPTISIEGFM